MNKIIFCALLSFLLTSCDSDSPDDSAASLDTSSEVSTNSTEVNTSSGVAETTNLIGQTTAHVDNLDDYAHTTETSLSPFDIESVEWIERTDYLEVKAKYKSIEGDQRVDLVADVSHPYGILLLDLDESGTSGNTGYALPMSEILGESHSLGVEAYLNIVPLALDSDTYDLMEDGQPSIEIEAAVQYPLLTFKLPVPKLIELGLGRSLSYVLFLGNEEGPTDLLSGSLNVTRR